MRNNKNKMKCQSITKRPSVAKSCSMITLACSFWFSSLALAGDVPNLSKDVDFNVREQEFADFSDAFFRQIGVPLVIDGDIEGTVNGRFNGTAGDVLEEISAAFNIVSYYDGAVAYVYNANQLFTRIVPATSNHSRQAVRLAGELSLPDQRNRLTVQASGLLVNGTPRFIEQIENLVESLQAQPKPAAPVAKPVVALAPKPQEPVEPLPVYKVFKLKHAWANDTNFQVGNESVTIPGVATILRDLISEDAFTVNSTRTSAVSGRGTVDGLRGQGLNADTINASRENGVASEQRLTSRGSQDLIRIVADTRLNAVIVRDTADRIPAYESLIASLDVESKMVEIEATIIDINTDMSRELGVNWRHTSENGDLLFGDGTASDQGLIPGADLITSQGRGGVLSFMLGEPTEFLARIRALEERGAAKVVSKPHVITLSDVEAVLGASTEFFVRIAGNEEVDLFNVPVGTFLRVTPHVFEERGGNRIKLLVNIEDGTQSPAATVDSIPVVERATINTQAVINEGDSLLIGGMVRQSYTKSDYRVPILGSVPGIGRLFRSDRNSSTRVERLFMITPRLADGLGFNRTRDLPGLQGSEQRILSDAGQRIESVEWPTRSKAGYWPDEVEAPAYKANVAEGGNGALGVDGNVLRRVISPYKVEAWPVNSGVSRQGVR